MEQRILRPGIVELRIVERDCFMARVMDADLRLEARCACELAVALVLRFAEIHAGDVCAGMAREPAGSTPVARAGVDDPGFRPEPFEAAGHRRHRALRSGGDRLVVRLVAATMDVLAAPDVEVKVVRVAAVVIVARGLHDVRVTRAHDASSSVLWYFFSATWMKKSGSLSR